MCDLEREIVRLGKLASEGEDRSARESLATAIGRLVNSKGDPNFVKTAGRKVWAIFPFYNEAMILNIRLQEMASWVDEFVLVEAATTFTGVQKPYYADSYDFGELAPRVTRVRIDKFPECCVTPWAREFYQRDFAITALRGRWGEDDVIIASDVDEIAKSKVIGDFRGPFANLSMRTHAFFLNYCARAGTKHAARNSGFVCVPHFLADNGISHLRLVFGPKNKHLSIMDAGWHLTSMGGAEAITNKCRSYAHQETDKARWRDLDHNQKMLDAARRGIVHPVWERREVDSTFPAYVRQRQGELSEYLI